MRSPRSVPVLVLTSTFVIGLLAGCGSDPASPDAQATAGTQDEQVTLSVVSLIPGSEQAAFDAFDERVAQFEEMNPNITIEPVEYEWRATTFAAQLAGGTLRNVYEIPAKSIYGVALHYNRALFTQAGLDPDNPPTSEVKTSEPDVYIAVW